MIFLQKLVNTEIREFWSYNTPIMLIRQNFDKTFRIKQNIRKVRIFWPPALCIQVWRSRQLFETYAKIRKFQFLLCTIDILGALWKLQNVFILFQTQNMTNFWKNEHHRNLVQQNSLLWFLAKFWWKIVFFEILKNQIFFVEKSKITKR